MTVSEEQLKWALDNDPEFRKQYQTMLLAQSFGGQPTQPLQAAPEAPQRKKNVMAGILAGVLSIVLLIGAGYGVWRYFDVSITPVVPDESTMKPVLHSTSLFGKQTDALVQEVRQTALDAIRVKAIESGICNDANEAAQGQIRTMLAKLGFTKIDISSNEVSCL